MFEYNGKKYIVEKRNDETNEMYFERIYYISLCNPTNDNEYKNALVEANILVNVKYLGCKYEKKIVEEVMKKRIVMNY
jgi:hypothetical protein